MSFDLDEMKQRYARFEQDERDSGFPYANDSAISCAYGMPELIPEVVRLREVQDAYADQVAELWAASHHGNPNAETVRGWLAAVERAVMKANGEQS